MQNTAPWLVDTDAYNYYNKMYGNGEDKLSLNDYGKQWNEMNFISDEDLAALEAIEHSHEIYGEVAPATTITDIQPVEDRLTKQDLSDAMDRMIDALSAETESDLIIDGVVAGTQLIKKYLANNMTKNPEVTIK